MWYTFNWCLADPVPTAAPALSGPTPAPAAQPTAAPVSSEAVVTLYELDGEGSLTVNVSNLVKNNDNGRNGTLAWDACSGATFDNKAPLWDAKGSNIGNFRVENNWKIRTSTQCGLTYPEDGGWVRTGSKLHIVPSPPLQVPPSCPC